MKSEQKPKEIKVEFISVEVRERKWSELTLKEKCIDVFGAIWVLSIFAELLLNAVIVPIIGIVNNLVIFATVAIFVVWLIATLYLVVCDKTFADIRNTNWKRPNYVDWG